MPEDPKLLQIGSSPVPPPFRGLHSPGVRKHCQIIFACYFRKSSITQLLVLAGQVWYFVIHEIFSMKFRASICLLVLVGTLSNASWGNQMCWLSWRFLTCLYFLLLLHKHSTVDIIADYFTQMIVCLIQHRKMSSFTNHSGDHDCIFSKYTWNAARYVHTWLQTGNNRVQQHQPWKPACALVEVPVDEKHLPCIFCFTTAG